MCLITRCCKVVASIQCCRTCTIHFNCRRRGTSSKNINMRFSIYNSFIIINTMGIIFSCSNNSQCLCAVTVMIKINLSAKRMNCRCVLPCSIYKQVTVEICSAGFIINAMRSYITTASSSPFSAVTGSSYFSTTKNSVVPPASSVTTAALPAPVVLI